MNVFDVYAPDGTLAGTVRKDWFGPCWLATRAGFPDGVRFVDATEARDWLLGLW
jgi:hypothetical protein